DHRPLTPWTPISPSPDPLHCPGLRGAGGRSGTRDVQTPQARSRPACTGVGVARAWPGGRGLAARPRPSARSRSPLGGLLQLGVEVNVSSRVALGVSPRGTPILILKRCSTLLGHISLLSG
ncbi:Hypothetical predicted protein, partial [Marmota monax]